jgi:hypothetical protein
VPVLVHGPGQHGEVPLAVVINGHHPDDRLGLAVAGDQHYPGADPVWIAGLAQRGPAESLIVFVVQVGYQVDVRPSGLFRHIGYELAQTICDRPPACIAAMQVKRVACGAAGPASAAGYALVARPPHDGPQPKGADKDS